MLLDFLFLVRLCDSIVTGKRGPVMTEALREIRDPKNLRQRTCSFLQQTHEAVASREAPCRHWRGSVGLQAATDFPASELNAADTLKELQPWVSGMQIADADVPVVDLQAPAFSCLLLHFVPPPNHLLHTVNHSFHSHAILLSC
jgi:hypothetical protein